MDIEQVLQDVLQQKISVQEATKQLKNLPFAQLESATIDHHRMLRKGFGEVVFCEKKAYSHLKEIFLHYIKEDISFLATRITKEQLKLIDEDEAFCLVHFKINKLARTLVYYSSKQEKKELEGNIVICTAGTSDLNIAYEAKETANFFGSSVQLISDVGVAGIHRLFNKLAYLQKANVIICIAGMEGALASVVAGLVSCPVIAVPTSVGYGTNFNGITPLLTMLNSCAEGITVVNIDNGFGAAYSAVQINRLCR